MKKILLAALLLPATCKAQHWDINVLGGVTPAIVTVSTLGNEDPAVGYHAEARVLRHSNILHYGLSIGATQVKTKAELSIIDPNGTPLGLQKVTLYYGQPSLSFAALAGATFDKKICMSVGAKLGYVRHITNPKVSTTEFYQNSGSGIVAGAYLDVAKYFGRLGIGLNVQPQLYTDKPSIRTYKIIVIPASVSIHIRI